MTPEGKIKTKVRRVLSLFGDDLYSFMPVQYGYGATTLDYLCATTDKFSHNGPIFFAIETKAPGKQPTLRQQSLIAQLRRMGTKVFVIDSDDGVEELRVWLLSLK